MRKIIDRILELEASLITPDCGDNSCNFATDKSGMRTNGGCRCGQNRSNLYFRELHKIRNEVKPLLLRMKALEDLADVVREVIQLADPREYGDLTNGEMKLYQSLKKLDEVKK